MENRFVFDYFYGAESEQFAFFRIPKLLIKDERFKGLSNDAKLLYGLMLDRMSLSVKNKWFDDENRAYIIYTVENVMEDLCCANGKASKLLIRLEEVGLIERKKPGLGRPAQTYVKNFMSAYSKENAGEADCPHRDPLDISQNEPVPEAGKALEYTAVRKSHIRECENHMSGSAVIALPDVRESHLMTCGNRDSGNAESAYPKVPKSHSNNTDLNKTDFSDTEFSHTHSVSREREKERILSEMQTYEAIIKENLWYDYYMNDSAFPDEGKRLFAIMYRRILRMVTDPPDYLVVKDQRIPRETVKSVFLKLKSDHVLYCIDKLSDSGTEIRNPGAYIDSMLYSSLADYQEHDTISAVQALGAFKRDFWPICPEVEDRDDI